MKNEKIASMYWTFLSRQKQILIFLCVCIDKKLGTKKKKKKQLGRKKM